MLIIYYDFLTLIKKSNRGEAEVLVWVMKSKGFCMHGLASVNLLLCMRLSQLDQSRD